MAIKGLALIEERDRRKKKKEKELVQLKSPEKKETTTVKKTVNNKGTTYVDRNTISKKPTTQNTTQNRVVTNKDRLSSNSTFGGINTDIRTVKTQNKPKQVYTADIYERDGNYYYKDGKKEKEIDRSFVEDAIKNKRTGVIGRYDSKGTLRTTDEKGNVKEQSLLNKAGYLGRTAKTRAKKGTIAIADAALQEAQNDLQKGEKLKTTGDKIAKFASAILNSNPEQGMRTAISKAMANSREIWKDKDKNALQKYVGTVLEGSQAISTGSTQGLKDITELAGSLDKNLDEKVAKAQQKLDAPVNKELEQLEQEKYNYGKGMRRAADIVGTTANMAPGIATSIITRNPELGILPMGLSAKGQTTERALQQGADLDAAVKMGSASGLVEIGTEQLSGLGLGIFGKGTLDDVVENTINSKIRNKGINFLAKQGFGLTGEVGEEVISDLAGLMIDKGTIDPNAKYTFEDFLETAKNTFGSTILTNLLTGGYGGGAYKSNIADMQDFQTKQLQQAEVIEQVNNGTIDKSEANQKFEQIENGTYEQNKNLDQIAAQQRDAIVQAVQTGQLSQVEATQEMEALNNTLTSERERINTPQEITTNENNLQVKQVENKSDLKEVVDKDLYNVDINDVENQIFRENYKLNEDIDDENGPVGNYWDIDDTYFNLKDGNTLWIETPTEYGKLKNGKTNYNDEIHNKINIFIEDANGNIVEEKTLKNDKGEFTREDIINEIKSLTYDDSNKQAEGQIDMFGNVHVGKKSNNAEKVETKPKNEEKTILDKDNKETELSKQLERQGTKILEEAEALRNGMIDNFKEYLEEHNITNPTQEDINNSLIDLLGYDFEMDYGSELTNEKLYNKYVREYMKENNIPFKENIQQETKNERNLKKLNKTQQKALNKTNNDEKLTEKEFYGLYSAHKIYNTENAQNIINAIKEEGFKGDGGFGVNLVPSNIAYKENGEPMFLSDRQYAPRKGEYVLLVPESEVDESGGGYRVRQGYKPRDFEVVKVERDFQPYYELYEKTYNNYIKSKNNNVEKVETNQNENIPATKSENVISEEVKAQQQKTVNTNDKIDKRLEKYKNNNLTKEQQNQILKIKDQLEKDINLIKDTSENMYSSEEKGRKIKGYSLQAAGEIREIIQGDSLDLIDNGLTPTELQKKLDRENSNYNGKEVIVDGKKGKILSRAYGKYKIELEDGNVVTKTKEEFESAKKIPRFVSEVNDYRTIKQEGETTEENEKRYYHTNSLQNENVITIKNDNLKDIPKNQIKGENTGISIDGKEVKMETPIDSKPNKLGQYVPKDGFTKKELKSGKLGDSKFYKNVTERADFINDEVREKIKNDDYIEHYRKVTNEESMQEAFNDLNTRGTEAIADFFNNDKELTSKDTAMGWLLIAQSQENGDYDFSNQVLRKMRSNATKTGQTMQMYNYYARLTPEGMYKWCGDQLLRAEEIFEQGKTKKWIEANKKRWQLNGKEVEFIKSQMQRVQELNQMNDNDTTTIDVKGKTKEVTVDRAKQVEIAKIQAMIENKIPPEKGKAINAWMRISMLGNLKTIGTRNPLGNIALRPVNDVGDFFSSMVDYAISKKTGVRTKGNVNLKAQAKGLKKGASETVQDFRLGINTRNAKGNRFEIGEGKSFNEQNKIKALNVLAKGGNKADSGVSFLLDLGDRPFYEANYQQSLENQMRLNGIEKIEDVPDWMKTIAETEGLERTYQDDNNYTKSVIAIRNAMNMFNVKGYGLGDVIIPFAKTPANLTKAIVDYSPAGFVNAITKGNQLRTSIDNGQFTPEMQHAFVNQLGKATAGTILYSVGAALANSGLITGGSDEDKDVADFMKNTLGIQPYSIKIGNKSYTYDWAQPLASGLAIPADIKKTLEDAKEGEVDLEYIIHKSFSTAGSVLLEQSFLQGIKDVLGGYGDPIDNLLSEIEGLPARAIPTLFQQIVTYLDGTKRMSYGNKGIQNMKAQAQAKTPWAKDLPVYRNSLGKEVKMYGGKNNFFNVFINPANYSEGQVTESAEEIYKIYQATNKKDILPRLVSNDLKNEDGTKLTNKQKSDFLKISGDIIDDNVKELKNNYDYRNMSDEDKAEAIKGIVEYAYNKARNEITGHELSSEYQKTDNAVESGYALADYYATQKYLKSITPKKEKTTPTRNRYEELMEKGIDGITFDKFKNYATNTRGESRTGGLSKNQKIKNYIQKLPLTAKQKAALWKDYKENQRFFTYYN